MYVKKTDYHYKEKRKVLSSRQKNCIDCLRIQCDVGCVCDCHPRHWW